MPKAAEKLPARTAPRGGARGSKSRSGTRAAATNGHVRYFRSARAGVDVRRKKRRPSNSAATPFPFYAVVEVRRTARLATEVRGHTGVILGRAKSNRGHWNYTVSLQGLEGTYCLPHTALRRTGTVLTRDDLYGDRAWRVTVDRSGTGTRADEAQSRAG